MYKKLQNARKNLFYNERVDATLADLLAALLGALLLERLGARLDARLLMRVTTHSVL